MDHFAGLDVSVKETSVCIVDETGRIVREVRVCARRSWPAAHASATDRFAKGFGYIIFQFAFPFRIRLNRQAAIVRSFLFVYEANLNKKIYLPLCVRHRLGVCFFLGRHHSLLFV